MIGDKASVAQKAQAVDISTSAHVVGRSVRSGLYVGVSGDLVVKFDPDGADITFKAVAVGYHPLSVYSVEQATTATDIVALW